MDSIVLGTAEGLRTVGDGDGDPLDGADVTALAHGADGERWAVVDGNELHRLGEGHATRVASTDEAIAAVEVHGGTVWCGTAGAHLLRLDGDRLERVATFDDAPTHDEWHTPWGGPPTVWSMASTDDRLLVNVHVGGILATGDRGETWIPTIDLYDDVHQVTVDDAGVLWAATGAGGLARSDDDGATWDHFDDLDEAYLRSVAPVADGVLVGGSAGPSADTAHLYRFDDGLFEPVAGGLPASFGGNVDAGRLVARDDTVVVADPGGALYVSGDAGHTWRVAVSEVPEVRSVLLV